MADAALLLAWRNDPETRRASISTDPVALDTHLAWLERTLASPARSLLVAERDSVAVGTVRLDRAEGWIELNWTVAPDQRGRGVGGAMVAAAAAACPGLLLAVIRPENTSSQAVAARAGFRQGESADGLQRWWRQPVG